MTNQLLAESTFPRDHNQPPLSERIAEAVEPLLTKRAELLALAETSVIIDDESAGKVLDLIKILHGFEKAVDAQRDEMMRPYLEMVREINAAFNGLAGPVTLARVGPDGRGGLVLMQRRYDAQREAAAQAERDRLLAEQRQREAEAEAARRAAEEKARAGKGSVADELAVMQAQEAANRLARQATAIRPQPVRSHLGSVGHTRRIAFEITDLRKCLGWLLRSTLRTKLQKAADDLIRGHLRELGVDAVEAGAVADVPGLSARVVREAQVR
jgi:hypothetical protein